MAILLFYIHDNNAQITNIWESMHSFQDWWCSPSKILWPITARKSKYSWKDSGEATIWHSQIDTFIIIAQEFLKSVCGQPTSYAGLQLQPVMHGMNLTGGVLGQSYFLKSNNGYINVIKCHCSMQWEVCLQATAIAGQLLQLALGGMNTEEMNLETNDRHVKNDNFIAIMGISHMNFHFKRRKITSMTLRYSQ